MFISISSHYFIINHKFIGVLVGLIAVSLFWGATNPFMKKGAKGVTEVKSSSRIGQFLNEIGFLVKNTSVSFFIKLPMHCINKVFFDIVYKLIVFFQYLIPFLINQIGSVIFIFVLQNADISLAVPVTNSLTFLFTAITGWFLGEKTALSKK